MTNYVAEGIFSGGGATQTLTERSGTTSSDTVPEGCVLVMRNTGAGTHVVTLTVNGLFDGLAVTGRAHSIPAGAIRAARVPSTYGDVNNLVAVAIDGATPSEVKYYVIGA